MTFYDGFAERFYSRADLYDLNRGSRGLDLYRAIRPYVRQPFLRTAGRLWSAADAAQEYMREAALSTVALKGAASVAGLGYMSMLSAPKYTPPPAYRLSDDEKYPLTFSSDLSRIMYERAMKVSQERYDREMAPYRGLPPAHESIPALPGGEPHDEPLVLHPELFGGLPRGNGGPHDIPYADHYYQHFPSFMSTTLRTTLTTPAYGGLNHPGASVYTGHVVYCPDSLYHPIYHYYWTGAGSAQWPIGWCDGAQQYLAIYNRYHVTGYRLKITMTNLTAPNTATYIQAYVCSGAFDGNSLLSDPTDLLVTPSVSDVCSQPDSQFCVMKTGADGVTAPSRTTFYFDCTDLVTKYGERMLDNRFDGKSDGSKAFPTQPLYLRLYWYLFSATDTLFPATTAILDQDVMFYAPKSLTQA